jgi:hypothetical protein
MGIGQASILLDADAARQAYPWILAQVTRIAAQLAAHLLWLRALLDAVSWAGVSARGARRCDHESIREGEPRFRKPHSAAPKDRVPRAGAQAFDVLDRVERLGLQGVAGDRPEGRDRSAMSEPK